MENQRVAATDLIVGMRVYVRDMGYVVITALGRSTYMISAKVAYRDSNYPSGRRPAGTVFYELEEMVEVFA